MLCQSHHTLQRQFAFVQTWRMSMLPGQHRFAIGCLLQDNASNDPLWYLPLCDNALLNFELFRLRCMLALQSYNGGWSRFSRELRLSLLGFPLSHVIHSMS